MTTPTHIWIFKSNDPEKQRIKQEYWRDSEMTMVCEFAATFSLSSDEEHELRKTAPENLDPVDTDSLIQFFGRVDGRAVAP